MKEIKNTQIKVRITPVERMQIDEYCGKYNLSISDFIRMSFKKTLQEEMKQ